VIRTVPAQLALAACGLVAVGMSALHYGPVWQVPWLVTPTGSARGSPYQVRVKLPDSAPLAAPAAATHEDAGDETMPSQPPIANALEDPADKAPTGFDQAFDRPERAADARFDIRAYGTALPAGRDGLLRSKKTVSLGGTRLGSVDLAMGRGSMVAVDRRALLALMMGRDERVATALTETDGELVSFDALRDRGVKIRYDALGDTIVIDSGE